MPRPKRVILIVLDSVGVGELPDARIYGDEGSDTLGNIARRVRCACPTLRRLGLERVSARRRQSAAVGADRARSAAWPRRSPGKDSVTGHWELMGLVLDRAVPDVPAWLSRRADAGVRARASAAGRSATWPPRAPRSSTSSGRSTCATGKPIVYTSADSVFQIAAHEDVVPGPELYRCCEIAFELAALGLGVGRVIARPFVGAPGAFTRTANRRDFALTPFAPTLLDRLKDAGHDRSSRSARSRICSPGAA